LFLLFFDLFVFLVFPRVEDFFEALLCFVSVSLVDVLVSLGEGFEREGFLEEDPGLAHRHFAFGSQVGKPQSQIVLGAVQKRL